MANSQERFNRSGSPVPKAKKVMFPKLKCDQNLSLKAKICQMEARTDSIAEWLKTSGVKHQESKANIRCKSKMIKAAKTQIYPVQPAIE